MPTSNVDIGSRPVTFLYIVDTGANCRDLTREFMPDDQWQIGCRKPSLYDVGISATNAAPMDTQQNLSRTGLRSFDLLETQVVGTV